MPGLSFMPTASCWAFVDPYALGCLVGQKPDGHQPLLWEAQQEVALELGFFNFALERGPPLGPSFRRFTYRKELARYVP